MSNFTPIRIAARHVRMFARAYARVVETSKPATVTVSSSSRLVLFMTSADPKSMIKDLRDHMSELNIPQIRSGKDIEGWAVDLQELKEGTLVSVYVQV